MRRTTVSKPAGARSEYAYPGDHLHKHWAQLHKGDREPYPTEQLVSQLAAAHAPVGKWVTHHGGAAAIAEAVQEAWRAFHSGDFARAMRTGTGQGALGAAVANKAAAIHTLYLETSDRKRIDILQAAVKRGEHAVEQVPDYANAHYTLALVLGRYSQRISIVEAVAAGYASRVREHLERTLELEPKHAEAHIALGLFHAEIVNTLGGLAARFTYGASESAALEHFRQAVKLAPSSAIAHVEYARGLLLLDADAHREEVEKLCALGAKCKPLDVMESLDVDRAKNRCSHL